MPAVRRPGPAPRRRCATWSHSSRATTVRRSSGAVAASLSSASWTTRMPPCSSTRPRSIPRLPVVSWRRRDATRRSTTTRLSLASPPARRRASPPARGDAWYWEQALELQELIEERVADSVSMLCVLSARSLYVCALANTHLGNDDETARLEAKAMLDQGYGTVLDMLWLLLALHRGDHESRVAARGAGRPDVELVLPRLDGDPGRVSRSRRA